jgi:hypothetical protein
VTDYANQVSVGSRALQPRSTTPASRLMIPKMVAQFHPNNSDTARNDTKVISTAAFALRYGTHKSSCVSSIKQPTSLAATAGLQKPVGLSHLNGRQQKGPALG